MKISSGILTPGVGLGEYKIGMDKKSVLARLGSDTEWDELAAPIEWIIIYKC